MDSSTRVVFKLAEYMKQQNNQNNLSEKILPLQPQVIGGFSVTSERFYRSDTNELKFLVVPETDKFPLNLNKQHVLFNEHGHHAEYLDKMLYFIRDHQDAMVKSCAVQADVVTRADVLETLMRTLYMKRNWSILGSRYRNTIYLCLTKPSHSGLTPAELATERNRQIMEAKLKQFLFSGKAE